MKKGVSGKIVKNFIVTGVLLSLWYLATTADYAWLTKNTWDTLTATNWNQLIDNVKGIQTDSSGNVSIKNTTGNTNLLIQWWTWWQWFLNIKDWTWAQSMQLLTNWAWTYVSVTDRLSFWIDGGYYDFTTWWWPNSLLRINANWNVWISEAFPAAKLHITDTATNATLRFEDGSESLSEINWWTYWAGGNSKLSFRTQEDSWTLSTKMVILDNGNIWIGTTGPSEKIDVLGDVLVTNWSALSWKLSGNFLSFNRSTGPSYILNGSSDANASLRIWVDSSLSNIKEWITIKQDWNVWIWKTAPDSTLHVVWEVWVQWADIYWKTAFYTNTVGWQMIMKFPTGAYFEFQEDGTIRYCTAAAVCTNRELP